MPWLTAFLNVLPLIVRGTEESIALARRLYGILTSTKEPTPADWDDLEKRAKKTAFQKVLEILAEAGIPLDSPIAIEMLLKVTPPAPVAAPVAPVGAPSTGDVTTIITSPAPTVVTQVPTP